MKLYSTAEAAEYLGLSLAAMKYHTHIAENLRPQKVGHSLVFTQAQLDEFLATRRKPGRPRKEKEHEPTNDNVPTS